MASCVHRVQISCVWIFSVTLISFLCSCRVTQSVAVHNLNDGQPVINSVIILKDTSVTNKNANNVKYKLRLELNGSNLVSGTLIKATTNVGVRGTICDDAGGAEQIAVSAVRELKAGDGTVAEYEVDVEDRRPRDAAAATPLFWCVGVPSQPPHDRPGTVASPSVPLRWIHQGRNVTLAFPTDLYTQPPKSTLSSDSNHLERNRGRRDTWLKVDGDGSMMTTEHGANEEEDGASTTRLGAAAPPPGPGPHRGSSSSAAATRPIGFDPKLYAEENRPQPRAPAPLPPTTNKTGDFAIHAVRLEGFRVEQVYKDSVIEDDGTPSLLVNTDSTIRLFGTGITENTVIIFTDTEGEYGGNCLVPVTKPFQVLPATATANGHNALVEIHIPQSGGNAHGTYFFCTKETAPSNATPYEIVEFANHPFIHQGSEPWLRIRTHEKLLPIWASIIIIVVCLTFSALFSGLNLGLMSLDRTELKILCNTGTEKERRYASKIQPVRDHGNFLLCSILLGNVFVNSIFTILLDDLTSGLIAVVFSTLMIVLFGEITPQALCSRHGLAVGAKTIFITRAVMVLTSPLSYPISKILDVVLGEEIGNVYNRERLKELVKVTTDTNDLDKDEVNIISGALELRKKIVADVMTRIEDVFMLDYDSILDFETVSEIMKSGFSRIPVFEGNRNNIVTMLYIKDLAFVDPDDNTPLKTLCQFYQNPCNFVFEDVTLDVMFKQFKEGHKGHMAFVHRVNNEGEGDPFYETVGLVTLEDVIEELIQAEIMDETDVFTDNRSKRRRNEHRKQDFTIFAERRENQHIRISPQLTLATFQYLSTSIDIFKPDTISETILRRMLKQDIIVHIKKSKDKHDPASVIYQQGKPVDYFVLILEGRVEVTVGRENLMFESGPFTYFGTQALMQNIGGVAESPVQPPNNMGSLQSVNMDALLRHTFVPDYSVRAIAEVLYIRIKRSLYMAAKRATLMERSQKDTTTSTPGDQFDDEVEKLLHSLEDDTNSVGRTSPIHSEINESSPKEGPPIKPSVSHHNSPPVKEKTPPSTAIATMNSTSPRDLNGTIKLPMSVSLFVESGDKDEEAALLPQLRKAS